MFRDITPNTFMRKIIHHEAPSVTRLMSRNRLCFQGAPTTTPVLRPPSVDRGPRHAKNSSDHFGTFAFLHTPHRALAHSLQRLVIKSPRVIFSHTSMESFPTHQVKKNVLLVMNGLIELDRFNLKRSCFSPHSPDGARFSSVSGAIHL
jgi:hypothetical protein